MKIWKNKKTGLVEIEGNSVMIDTEGIGAGGGIYQISLLAFNANGEAIGQKSWYVSENIDKQIKMHKNRNHNKDKGVYKKLLKIRSQDNSYTTIEQVQKSIIKFFEDYKIQNVLGQSIYYYDLPLLRNFFGDHLRNIWGDKKYFDTRIHYQRAVDHNPKYKNYKIDTGRYKVDTLSKHFLSKKEKHTATNDCKQQLELLKMLEIA